jgi:hypothetical protein
MRFQRKSNPKTLNQTERQRQHFDDSGKQFCTCVTLVVLVENGQQPKRKRNPIGYFYPHVIQLENGSNSKVLVDTHSLHQIVAVSIFTATKRS